MSNDIKYFLGRLIKLANASSKTIKFNEPLRFYNNGKTTTIRHAEKNLVYDLNDKVELVTTAGHKFGEAIIESKEIITYGQLLIEFLIKPRRVVAEGYDNLTEFNDALRGIYSKIGTNTKLVIITFRDINLVERE